MTLEDLSIDELLSQRQAAIESISNLPDLQEQELIQPEVNNPVQSSSPNVPALTQPTVQARQTLQGSIAFPDPNVKEAPPIQQQPAITQIQQKEVAQSQGKQVPFEIGDKLASVGGVLGAVSGFIPGPQQVAVNLVPLPARSAAGAAAGQAIGENIENVLFGQNKSATEIAGNAAGAAAIDGAAALAFGVGGKVLGLAGNVGKRALGAATGSNIDEVIKSQKGEFFQRLRSLGGVGEKIADTFDSKLTQVGQAAIEGTDDQALSAGIATAQEARLQSAKKQSGQLFDVVDQKLSGLKSQGTNTLKAARRIKKEINADKTKELEKGVGSTVRNLLGETPKQIDGVLIDPATSKPFIKDGVSKLGFDELRSTRSGLNAFIKKNTDDLGNVTPVGRLGVQLKEAVEKDITELAEQSPGAAVAFKQANKFFKDRVVPLKDKFANKVGKTLEEAPEDFAKKFLKKKSQIDRLDPIIGQEGLQLAREQLKRDLFERSLKTDVITGVENINPKIFLNALTKNKKVITGLYDKATFNELRDLAVQGIGGADILGKAGGILGAAVAPLQNDPQAQGLLGRPNGGVSFPTTVGGVEQPAGASPNNFVAPQDPLDSSIVPVNQQTLETQQILQDPNVGFDVVNAGSNINIDPNAGDKIFNNVGMLIQEAAFGSQKEEPAGVFKVVGRDANGEPVFERLDDKNAERLRRTQQKGARLPKNVVFRQ